MDDRAYHLATRARQAVSLAIAHGELKRQPCEVCGAVGQAHHDSYFPDKWLDVRWLCGLHHRRWHLKHEPVWPTIFEHHPCDEKYFAYPKDRGKGRPNRPWFRRQNGKWYITHKGRQVNLGRDEEEAFRRFRQMQSEAIKTQ